MSGLYLGSLHGFFFSGLGAVAKCHRARFVVVVAAAATKSITIDVPNCMKKNDAACTDAASPIKLSVLPHF